MNAPLRKPDLLRDVRHRAHTDNTASALIEYDGCLDQGDDGDRSWFDITSFYVSGRDIEPELRKALGPDGMKKLEGVIEAALRRAREDA